MTPESTRPLGPPAPPPAIEKMPPGANGFPEGDDEAGDAAAAAAAAAMAAANSSSFLMAFCGNEVKVEVFSLMEVPATDLAAQ